MRNRLSPKDLPPPDEPFNISQYTDKPNQNAGTESSSGTIHRCQWRDCSEVFDSGELLYEHLCTVHITKRPRRHASNYKIRRTDTKLSCQWADCKVSVQKRDHLTSHVRIHIDIKPFECPRCFKKFKRPQDLKKHAKIHSSRAKTVPRSAESTQNSLKTDSSLNSIASSSASHPGAPSPRLNKPDYSRWRFEEHERLNRSHLEMETNDSIEKKAGEIIEGITSYEPLPSLRVKQAVPMESKYDTENVETIDGNPLRVVSSLLESGQNIASSSYDASGDHMAGNYSQVDMNSMRKWEELDKEKSEYLENYSYASKPHVNLISPYEHSQNPKFYEPSLFYSPNGLNTSNIVSGSANMQNDIYRHPETHEVNHVHEQARFHPQQYDAVSSENQNQLLNDEALEFPDDGLLHDPAVDETQNQGHHHSLGDRYHRHYRYR